MSSRDRRASLDPFEIVLRESLRAKTVQALPPPGLRHTLLQRAAGQQRRFSWCRPLAWPGLFGDNRFSNDLYAAQRHVLYVESLFGPRLGWFSSNQLMR